MNAPERSASFLLDEDSGEQKCVYTADTKVRIWLIRFIAIIDVVSAQHHDVYLIIFSNNSLSYFSFGFMSALL